jgi:hypothetical protein
LGRDKKTADFKFVVDECINLSEQKCISLCERYRQSMLVSGSSALAFRQIISEAVWPVIAKRNSPARQALCKGDNYPDTGGCGMWDKNKIALSECLQ